MRCFAVLIVLFFLAPTAASAHYAGERPWTGATAEAVYATADAYWTARGLPGPRPELLIADNLCNSDGCPTGGRGDQHTLRLWIRSDVLSAPAARLCATVTHELGHVRGLAHTDAPADPMYAGPLSPIAECLAAFPPARMNCAHTSPARRATRHRHRPGWAGWRGQRRPRWYAGLACR